MTDLSAPIAAPIIIVAAGMTALTLSALMARILAAAGFLPDQPNGRSSHHIVTPRSGGVAIVLSWFAGLAIFAGFAVGSDVAASATKFALLVGFVCVCGLVDDRFALRAHWKFAGQLIAAWLFVTTFGALETAPLPVVGDTALGAFAAPLTIFWIVGFINAYNFMDGINGIASACAVLALSAIAVVATMTGAYFWGVAAGLAAASVIGFLPLNFLNGRLFMGDNGSHAVGFLIAATAVAAAIETNGTASALFVPVLMLPFIFDVSFTLAHRLARRQNVLTAHCEHLYQLMARLGQSHASVTAIYVSLTALSAASAIFMLRLAPATQWIVPAVLIVLLLFPAILVFQAARGAGLLAARGAADASRDDEELDVAEGGHFEQSAVRAAE